MRGADTFTESLLTMRKLEDFVPAKHPLRAIREMANAALVTLAPVLAAMYAAEARGPSSFRVERDIHNARW
jgi:hypothetical protein